MVSSHVVASCMFYNVMSGPWRDLVLGVCLFSRLLQFTVWSQLDLVYCRKTVTQKIQELVENVESSLIQCTKNFLTAINSLLVDYFGTKDVFNMEEFTNIWSKKLLCGVGRIDKPLLKRVHIDNACVSVASDTNTTGYSVLTQVTECNECPLQLTWSSPTNIPDNQHINASFSFEVATRYSTYIEVRNANNTIACKRFKEHFEQYGLYQLNLEDCSISIEEKPVNAFLPIFWAFVILCGLAGLRLLYQSVYKTAAFRRFLVWVKLRSEMQHDLGSGLFSDTTALVDSPEVIAKESRRVKSLDAFRGLAITIMIFVNYGGGSYYFFNHSPWNGLTVADLVFPWFMWIMGVSLTISIQSQLRNSVNRRLIMTRVIKRSIILIILGVILNTDGGKNDLSKLRIPGVLQRFGLSYLVVGLVESLLLPREYPSSASHGRLSSLLLDMSTSGWQFAVMAALVALHTGLTFQLPVPGCPTGYLGPGGLAENNSHPNCTGGAAMWIDVSIFGSSHIYQHPTCSQIYKTSTPHDPEGLLGTLTSIVLVWLGVVAGKILLVYPGWRARICRWITWSIILGLLSAILAGFSKNSGVIPINKNLWSLSFIFCTGAMAFLLLSMMYLLIDVFKFWSGSPLTFPGMNSILLYVGHEMVSGMFPWSWRPFTTSHSEMLAMNMWGAGLWVITSFVLYNKKIFLAV